MIKGKELYTNQAGDIAVYLYNDVVTLYHLIDNKPVVKNTLSIDEYLDKYNDQLCFELDQNNPEYSAYSKYIGKLYGPADAEDICYDMEYEYILNHKLDDMVAIVLGLPSDYDLPY